MRNGKQEVVAITQAIHQEEMEEIVATEVAPALIVPITQMAPVVRKQVRHLHLLQVRRTV